MRIGFGCDVHPFDEKKDLYLGGVKIPNSPGLKGHSDADVLLHAVCDALLGAAGLGDIGEHFPDTDMQYKNKASVFFLKSIMNILKKNNFKIGNLDIMLLAEKPKILPYKPEMKSIIAGICEVGENCVNIKASTTERLGFVGRGEGITAYAIALIKETE